MLAMGWDGEGGKGMKKVEQKKNEGWSNVWKKVQKSGVMQFEYLSGLDILLKQGR